MNKLGLCPSCGVSWDGGSILETFKKQREEEDSWCWGWSNDKLQKEIESSYPPPYRWSRLIGVEYGYGSPERYDGISEYRCPDCGTRWGRWTEKIIPAGYIESRFGKEGHVKPIS